MFIAGVVITGKQRGRELGFPTANIPFDKQISPGVYSGWIFYQKRRFRAAIYVHFDQRLLEAHILDFESDLYGKHIRVELGEKIRDPIQFDSVDALKEQIARDVEKIREVVYGGGNLS